MQIKKTKEGSYCWFCFNLHFIKENIVKARNLIHVKLMNEKTKNDN